MKLLILNTLRMKRILISFLAGLLLMQSCSQVSDHFTIIGKTTGFKDSTMLYLQDSKSVSLIDNMDSTYVINNSFTFKGNVSEPKRLTIHTGYTGWEIQPPESFHYVVFFVDNKTIYLKDEIGNLTYSTFTGSELQNDNTDYINLIKEYLINIDSISKALQGLAPSDSLTYKALGKEEQWNFAAMNEAVSVFITTHPKSILSIESLNAFKNTYGKEKTKKLFSQLDPKIQNTTEGKSIMEYEEFVQPEYVKNFGDLNDIELPNLNGELIKLSSLKGKYILLEFWASWCGGCRLENPDLVKLYNTYKAKGFEIYAVSLDDKKENWQKAVLDDKITWITVSDLKGEDSKEAVIYKVTGIPKNYLVDREGKIIAQNIRGKELANKLAEIFNSQ
jgi:thiol-disulfide isomerase/thioredoxin